MASQITGVSMVYSAVCSGTDQRKHLSSASLAFVRGIYRWPTKSPHKGPVTRKMLPFVDVIMSISISEITQYHFVSVVSNSGKYICNVGTSIMRSINIQRISLFCESILYFMTTSKNFLIISFYSMDAGLFSIDIEFGVCGYVFVLSNTLQWRHNGRDCVSNHQPHDCYTQAFIQAHIRENIIVPRHWPLWGIPPVTGGFPSQRASNAENVSISWRHHGPVGIDKWLEPEYIPSHSLSFN